jgi:hypothetical protein
MPSSSLKRGVVLTTCLFYYSTQSYGFTVTETSRISPTKLRAHHQAPSSNHADASHSLQVQIFDSVFTRDTCETLHDLALEHSERGKDGSSVFYRGDAADLTPLEYALDSCLTQLGDTNDICEYWSRNEYIHMDAHADIDEQQLEDEEQIRCPEFGHVLYLDLAPNIRGPTCVFSEYGGWANVNTTTTIVTVPAVQGRVLRFPGSAMHAAPKPTNRWFLSQQEEEQQLRDDDADENDMWDDEDEVDVERSVILFNTWSNQGPRGVTQDYTKGTIPDGIELDDVDDKYMEQQKLRRIQEWQEDYGKDCCDIWCQPRTKWMDVDIVDNNSLPADTTLRISLMGKKTRRLHPMQHVQLVGPSTLREVLGEESQPSQSLLKQEERS